MKVSDKTVFVRPSGAWRFLGGFPLRLGGARLPQGRKAIFFWGALGVFLVLILGVSSALQAKTPGGEEALAVPEVKTYEDLRQAISQARAESRVRVEKAAEQERVREAWEIGRLIDAHVLSHKERADYAEHVLTRLAGDLGMSERELYYSLRFYRAYPILTHASKLSWSDYRDLLSVDDSKKRLGKMLPLATILQESLPLIEDFLFVPGGHELTVFHARIQHGHLICHIFASVLLVFDNVLFFNYP